METVEQIAEAVLAEIDNYELPESHPSLVGTPWGPEKYAEEVEVMRRCLIAPCWHLVRVGPSPGDSTYLKSEIKRMAMVARDVDYSLFYDPEKQIYALGFEEEGRFSTFMYGDAVSTFLAR